MYTQIKQVVQRAAPLATLVTAAGATIGSLAASVPIAIDPSCDWTNQIKAGGEGTTSNFSYIMSNLLGIAQAGAGLFLILGVIGLIFFAVTKFRGPIAKAVLIVWLLLTFGPGLVGFFSQNAGGGCSFI